MSVAEWTAADVQVVTYKQNHLEKPRRWLYGTEVAINKSKS